MFRLAASSLYSAGTDYGPPPRFSICVCRRLTAPSWFRRTSTVNVTANEAHAAIAVACSNTSSMRRDSHNHGFPCHGEFGRSKFRVHTRTHHSLHTHTVTAASGEIGVWKYHTIDNHHSDTSHHATYLLCPHTLPGEHSADSFLALASTRLAPAAERPLSLRKCFPVSRRQ